MILLNMLTMDQKRLYFLKQLKRAGVPHAQLLHFYLAVIRPVLEYAAPAVCGITRLINPKRTRLKQYKRGQYKSYSVAHVTCLILVICCWTGGTRESQGSTITQFLQIYFTIDILFT